MAFNSREECEAVFNQLDKNRNGAISREEFEAFLATKRGGADLKMRQPLVRPKAQTMNAGYAAAPAAGQGLYGDVKWEASEDVRSIKDTRRLFALAGPLLLSIMAFIPCWGCLGLMRSPTYLYFSGDGNPFGGLMMLLAVVVILWMTCIMGVTCPYPPIPVPPPIRWLGERIRSFPTELWAMFILTLILLFSWKVVPSIMLNAVSHAGKSLYSGWYVVYIIWLSKNPAATIVAASVVSVVLYVYSLNYFFARGKPEHRGTVRSLFWIWTAFALFMGVSFMLLATPISAEATKAYQEIFVSCETAERARDLYVTSQALQSLRQNPDCASLESIEQCAGFQKSIYTNVLKSMESRFKCAGFCYNPEEVVPAVPTCPQAPFPISECSKTTTGCCFGDAMVNTYQTSHNDISEGMVPDLPGGHPMTTTENECMELCCEYNCASLEIVPVDGSFRCQLSSTRAGEEGGGQLKDISDGTIYQPAYFCSTEFEHNTQQTSAYPPTLFSTGNYQASCDGKAGRYMEQHVGVVGAEVFQQGVYLVIIGLVLAVIQILVNGDPWEFKGADAAPDYGSMK